MRTWLAYCCIVWVVPFICGCQTPRESDYGIDALKANGINVALNSALTQPEGRSTVTFGERHLVIQKYHSSAAKPQLGGVMPHVVVAGTPYVWGFGPVTVWEEHRLLLACKLEIWWILADIGGTRGMIFCGLYETHNANDDLEFDVYQEPRTDTDRQRLSTFFPVPKKMFEEGFMLRVSANYLKEPDFKVEKVPE